MHNLAGLVQFIGIAGISYHFNFTYWQFFAVYGFSAITTVLYAELFKRG